MKRKSPQLNRTTRDTLSSLSRVSVLAFILTGCIADSTIVRKSTSGTSLPNPDLSAELADLAQPGVSVSFNHSNFYTLTHPSNEGCAGDAKTFQRYLELDLDGKTTHFSTSRNNSSETFKPPFLKNVSVDLSDSNANLPSNQAFNCSYGAQPTVAAPSSCSTFDYGAIGGIPTSLGGSVLLIGGVGSADASHPSTACMAPTTLNDSSYCSGGLYALGVDTLTPRSAGTDLAPGLPADDGDTRPISSWANLNSAAQISTGVTPKGAAGSSIAYDPGKQSVLLFAGASPFSASNYGDSTSYPGSDTVHTWTYDIKTQLWTQENPTPFAASSISTLYDLNPTLDTPPSPALYLNKAVGGRALFGYIPVPNMALTQMTTSGDVAAADIDTTERILVIGGLNGSAGDSAGGVSKGTQRFNPTFGPEWVDALKWSKADNTLQDQSTLGTDIRQWMDSYHTQLMSNTLASTFFFPKFNASASGSNAYGMGAIPLISGTSPGFTGNALTAAGFDFSTVKIPSGRKGTLYYSKRRSVAALTNHTGNFLGLPNILNGKNAAPISWENIEGPAAAPPLVEWLGGPSMVQGFDKTSNDFILFGGSYCQDYLTNASATGCLPPAYSNYYTYPHNALSTTPTVTAFSTPPPAARVGMAVARGLDASGNVIIAAWGGMDAPADGAGVSATGDRGVWIARKLGATLEWKKTADAALGDYPTLSLTNSQMVFSHVTGKFYMYGGYQSDGVAKTVNETYELTVSGNCHANAGANAACTFAWRRLTDLMSCYPNCPKARRSHRMLEVNYNNKTPDVELIPATGCSSAAPCSFGIFMEGGTPDGYSVYSDRWMFDPTGNGGNGHWQRVDGFPPRRLAAMSAVDYELSDGSGFAHRAVLFGGETALQNPLLATSPQVAPTLGDTYVYDFDANSWQRVQLLGKGYPGAVTGFSYASEQERRQAYDATGLTDPSGAVNSARHVELSTLSPPPLSGAMMVTRTMNGPQGPDLEPGKLKIPEVFLFGGRLKDGTLHSLDQVYKFCLGSTGENDTAWGAPGNAQCDAYDAATNPDSTSGSRAYVGRWLKKNNITAFDETGAVIATPFKAFKGAATYDSHLDRIVFYGGLTGPTAVTDSGTLLPNSDSNIYEYTPPSGLATHDARNGIWNIRAACTFSTAIETLNLPAPRYGHSLSYDALKRQLVIVGGYNANGDLLQSTAENATGAPEVWTAKRISSASDLPKALQPHLLSTTPCYFFEEKTRYGNDPDDPAQAAPTHGLAHASSILIPSTGYNTGYYSMQDQFCTNAGPIASNDPHTSKLYAGGAYIDLDRKELGPHENVLLHLTYIPLGTQQKRPDGVNYSDAEKSVLKIHLQSTGLDLSRLRSVIQPRHLTFGDISQFAKIVQTLHVLAPASGAVRQDQILIPLSANPAIDRIRIERVMGSAILIDATIIRMGYR